MATRAAMASTEGMLGMRALVDKAGVPAVEAAMALEVLAWAEVEVKAEADTVAAAGVAMVTAAKIAATQTVEWAMEYAALESTVVVGAVEAMVKAVKEMETLVMAMAMVVRVAWAPQATETVAVVVGMVTAVRGAEMVSEPTVKGTLARVMVVAEVMAMATVADAKE